MLADPKANDKKYFRSTRVTFLPNSNTLCGMGEDVGECTQRLEGCANEAQIWAKQNACRFDVEKNEAILFT